MARNHFYNYYCSQSQEILFLLVVSSGSSTFEMPLFRNSQNIYTMFRYFLWICFFHFAAVACQSQVASKQPTVQDTLITATPAPMSADTLATPYDLNYVMGKFDPTSHPDFVVVSKKYANREGMYLHKDTYAAFQKMYEAALKDGVELTIISATRNFEAQKRIWEAKWNGERLVKGNENLAKTTPDPKARALKILLYSSMPGSSRHHWGTDLDINDLSLEYFEQPEGKKMYSWMEQHAAEYGFCQPYSPKGASRPQGYEEEKWHWSYLPVAKPLTDLAARHLKDEYITGFLGASEAAKIGIVRNYVLGINQACL